jgi:hypothetical protein
MNTPNSLPGATPGYADQMAKRLLKREHIVVIARGGRMELEEAAVRYGWQDESTRSYEPDAVLLAAVDLNTRTIFEVVSQASQYEGIRETFINYARYPKVFVLDQEPAKLEKLFFPEYLSPLPSVNPTVLAENISHWLDMLQLGFEFKETTLQWMLEFCHHNELFSQCALIRYHLDDGN